MAANLSNSHLGDVVRAAYAGTGVNTDMQKNPVLVPFLTDCVQNNTKNRLDALEVAYDALLDAMTVMAATMNAVVVPINGTAVGAALTAVVATASLNRYSRTTAKTTQAALPTPYIDGVK